jgi:hypothetical protein
MAKVFLFQPQASKIEPRISRISRMRNPSCLIRAIREIRGKKSYREGLILSDRTAKRILSDTPKNHAAKMRIDSQAAEP